MSFQGLIFASPASIEAVQVENLVPALDGGLFPIRFGHIRWRVSLNLEPRSFRNASKLLALHRSKHGNSRSFTILMPQITTDDLVNSTDYVVSNAGSSGDSTIRIESAGDITLPLGRFIKFSGHDKVYQVDGSDDYMITAAGRSISLLPNLLREVAVNETWSPNPLLTCRYAMDSGGFWNVDRRSIVAPTIIVEEV